MRYFGHYSAYLRDNLRRWHPQQIQVEMLPYVIPSALHLRDPFVDRWGDNRVPVHLDIQLACHPLQVRVGLHALGIPWPRRRAVLTPHPLPVLQRALKAASLRPMGRRQEVSKR